MAAKKSRNIWSGIYNRLGLDNFTYPVPEHAQTVPYMLGGIALAGFVILILSGIYLAQFYNPNQLSSNESVLFLISKVPFGNFIRSVHFWSATIVFVVVLLHLLRVFITGSYKRPREFTWLSGLGLLAITAGFIFTGTMLSLGQEGIEALEHNGEVGHLMGTLGLWFTAGFSASVPLIGRVYVAHITILAALFVLFIATHVYLIKIHGISPKAGKDSVAKSTSGMGKGHFNQHIVKLLGWSFILVAVLAFLAVISPEPLVGNGVAGLEATKPPWMFLWIFGFEDVFGIQSLVWGPALVLTLLAIIPFIDRSPYLSLRRRIKILIYGLVIIAGIVALSLEAAMAHTGASDTTGYRPTEQKRFAIVPEVYAHNMPFLSFTPTVVTKGDTVTISGDGLSVDGDYVITLTSPRKSVSLGTATVEDGEDMFDADFIIPSDIPGDMYTVSMHSVKDPSFTFYAPLELAIQPTTVSVTSDVPFSTSYAVPKKELPYIAALITVSLGVGVVLILKK